MNDLKGVAFFQQSRAMRFPGNNIAIKLDYNPTGTDLQLFKQPSQAQPIGYFPFFSVDANLHATKKTVPTAPPQGGREYGFKLVPVRPFSGL
jgi:hypothetical protein